MSALQLGAALLVAVSVLGLELGTLGCYRLGVSSREWRTGCCSTLANAPVGPLQGSGQAVAVSEDGKDVARDLGVLAAVLLVAMVVVLGIDTANAWQGRELQPSGLLIQMVLVRWVPVVACSFLPVGALTSVECEGPVDRSRAESSGSEESAGSDQTTRDVEAVSNAAPAVNDATVAASATGTEAQTQFPDPAATGPAAAAPQLSRVGSLGKPMEESRTATACCGCLACCTRPFGLSNVVRLVQWLHRRVMCAVEPDWIAPTQLSMHACVRGYIVLIFASLLIASVSDGCIGPINHLSGWAVVARAPALPLQVWLPVLLALVRLHASRRALRFHLGASHLLPLDDAAELHRMVAWIGFLLFTIHIVGHVGNLAVWADGPESLPDVFAMVMGHYPRFFDLLAGKPVWVILGNNFAVATGIVLTVSFMTMLILSEEKITRQRCPAWCACSRTRACCTRVGEGDHARHVAYCSWWPCMRCAVVPPASKQTVVLCCCVQGPAFASRRELVEEADEVLGALWDRLDQSKPEAVHAAETATGEDEDVRKAAGKTGSESDSAGAAAVAIEPAQYKGTEALFSRSTLAPAQAEQATELVDGYLESSRFKNTTSYGCFRMIKRACSIAALVAWLMHGASGVLGDPLVGSLTAGGVMVLAYLATELLDFWLGQGGCLSAPRVQVVAPLAYSVSGRIQEEADFVLPDEAASVAYHEARLLLELSNAEAQPGCTNGSKVSGAASVASSVASDTPSSLERCRNRLQTIV